MPTADKNLRDRLQQCRSLISELRDERAAAVKERDAARDAFANREGDLREDSTEFRDAKAAVEKVGAIDDELAAAQADQVALLTLLGEPSPESAAGLQGPGAPPLPPSKAWKSGVLLSDSETRRHLTEMSSTTLPVGRANLGYIADRDELAASFGADFAADVSGTTNMRRGDFIGVVPQLRRQLRIVDLLPVGTMDGATIPYTQEQGSFATAVETAEGGLKPEAAVTFVDAEASAKTIAHWAKARKQSLADFAALQTILDGRLRYGVERRLADQIVGGDGIGENIRGILNTSGIGSVAYNPGELAADQILRGLTSVLLSDSEANAILLHPTDWQNALMVKAVGDGHYYSGGPFSVTPHVLWGVPLIPSAAVPLGTALLGDFAAGAQLFIREGVIVLISDADQDDFIRNRVTILAEMRAALVVWRPAVFTTVRLAA